MRSIDTLRTDPDAFRDRPLHYCRMDAAGVPTGASYDLTPDAVDMPSAIRAGYGWREHPDMPQGVHSRMMQRLNNHSGAAGYYYCLDDTEAVRWISINVYPTSAGAVACHFEVISPQLQHLATFFAQLSASERAAKAQSKAGRLDADVASAKLLGALLQKDLPDYRAMALNVMVDEVFVRYAADNRPQFHALKQLYRLHQALKVVGKLGIDVGAVSGRSNLIPYQLKLQAARLESGKGPISVIASNHQELTASLLRITEDIHAASCTEIEKVSDALAYLAQSNHAAELIHAGPTCAQVQPPPGPLMAELHEVTADCDAQVTSVLCNIDKSASALIEISKRMRRALSAMEMTRLMCKVERANIHGPTEGLGNIVDHLEQVEGDLHEVMMRIDDAAKTVLELVKEMGHDTSKYAA